MTHRRHHGFVADPNRLLRGRSTFPPRRVVPQTGIDAFMMAFAHLIGAPAPVIDEEPQDDEEEEYFEEEYGFEDDGEETERERGGAGCGY